MLEAGWLQIVQRIGQENLDNVSLVTVTGNELVVQSVYRIEHDFMIVRARTAGTMDAGRILVVPFSQVDFLAFNKPMSEEQVQKLFEGSFQACAPAMMMAAPAPVSVSAPTPLPSPPPRPVVTESQVAAALDEAAPANDPNKSGNVSKTILLARLRERLSEKSK
jgi:hypothetical protein